MEQQGAIEAVGGFDRSACGREKQVGGNQAKWLFMKKENGEVTTFVL